MTVHKLVHDLTLEGLVWATSRRQGMCVCAEEQAAKGEPASKSAPAAVAAKQPAKGDDFELFGDDDPAEAAAASQARAAAVAATHKPGLFCATTTSLTTLDAPSVAARFLTPLPHTHHLARSAQCTVHGLHLAR